MTVDTLCSLNCPALIPTNHSEASAATFGVLIQHLTVSGAALLHAIKSSLRTMGDYAPFHVQLQDQLRRRFWTQRHLMQSVLRNIPESEAGSVRPLIALFERHFDHIMTGRMAPTRRLGEIVAQALISQSRSGDRFPERICDDLIGAAFVAESHGRRRQPPYTLGVLGESLTQENSSVAGTARRRREVTDSEQRELLLRRLIELEQAARTRSMPSAAPSSSPGKHTAKTPRKAPSQGALRDIRVSRVSSASLAIWKEAASASLEFIPDHCRNLPAARQESFVHVVERCYMAGQRFSQFLDELLVAWRLTTPTARGRIHRRMSPEQLGRLTGERNLVRYAADSRKQSWFRRHKGTSVTGNSLRNYLTAHSAKPQRECVRKLIWAFVADGPVQNDVEQRIWRMAADPFAIHSPSVSRMLEVVSADWSSPKTRLRIADQFPAARHRLSNVEVVQIRPVESSACYSGLADRNGILLTPLINPSTGRMLPDIVQILPESRLLRTHLDVALQQHSRARLMQALVRSSGIPVTRIAEMTGIHESLFQQWMREETNQRIDSRQRAANIVDLLNPPELARWPIFADQIRQQNDQAISILHSNVSSVVGVLNNARNSDIPTGLKLSPEARKTFIAAQILRQVFGRDSVTNLTGPQVGRLLESEQLGNLQTFRHLREGIRDGGRKAARRATVEQAQFLVSVAEAATGELDDATRRLFVECVACVNPDAPDRAESPDELLLHVHDPDSTVTIHSMVRQIIRQCGGLMRFSRLVGISPRTLRSFAGEPGHYLHHKVARKLAERGMGFDRRSELHRQFVVYSTAAWKKGGGRTQISLSELLSDYFDGRPEQLKQCSEHNSAVDVRRVRAVAMGRLLSQAALAPGELAIALRVTLPVLSGWTTPRGGHFTSAGAMARFIRLMNYRAEQADFVRDFFGPPDSGKTAR